MKGNKVEIKEKERELFEETKREKETSWIEKYANKSGFFGRKHTIAPPSEKNKEFK